MLPNEHVLVVPTAAFHALGHFQGFCGETDRYLTGLLTPELVSYQPRAAMEEDPGFKQFIPYVVFRHRDADGITHLFQYTRGGGQGEKRLHAKRSIGIGGHISSTDAATPSADPYREGLLRELSEEVTIGTAFTETCAGLINDDLTEVGRVHLGVVHLFDVETTDVRPLEEDILDAGFVPVKDLLDDLDRFETWSQICLKALFA